MKNFFAPFIAPLFCLALPLSAQENTDEPRYEADELADDLIHSDLPLYDFEWQEFWPRGIDEPEVIAGCTSRVAFGDWKFSPSSEDWSNPYWLRVQNYGAFHCFANFYASDEKSGLEEGEFSRGFFVKIGDFKTGGQNQELWAIQEGTRPGSGYTLLSRQPKEGLVTRFTVLQHRCPREKMRGLDVRIDIAPVEYCSINSRDELLEFAREMALLQPQGELVLSPKEKGPDTQAPDPS